MDETDGRIRAALTSLGDTADADRVLTTVGARLREPHAQPGPLGRAVPRLAFATLLTLALVVAVTGAVFLDRRPHAAASPSPDGSAPGFARPTGAGTSEPPEIVWTSEDLDAKDVGLGRMEAVVRGPFQLVAGGWYLDTGHHHNTETTERHHTEAVVWTSRDGQAWHRVEGLPGFEHARITSLAAWQGVVLAVGSGDEEGGGTSPRVWRSVQGEPWEIVSTAGLPADASIGTVTSTSDGFFLGGDDPWRSADGITWERVPVVDEPSADAWSVVDTSAGLVGVGYRDGRSPVLSRSADGVNWEAVTLADDAFGPDFVALDDLIAGGPGFIAAGRIVDSESPQDPAGSRVGPPTDGAIWTSRDLATWARVEPSRELFGGEEDQTITALEAVTGGYVALGTWGTRGAAWASADGFTWHKSSGANDAFGNGVPASVVPLGSELVVVGRDAQGPAVWRGRPPEALAGGGDLNALITALEAAGGAVRETDRFVPMPEVLGDDGRQLCVDSQRVTAYVFPAVDDASSVAATIDRDDPSHVGSATIIEWTGEPRFWQAGSVLVLYLGPDPRIEHGLTSVLGEPFARGSGRSLDPDQYNC